MGTKAQLEVAGRMLQVSNLDKLLYPEAGFRKADIINYYVKAGDIILPHLKDRPLTLKRYPEGVNGEHFYEKDAPSHKPDWVKTAPVARRGGGPDINFVLINDLPSLVWAANLASIELHVFLARAKHIHRPDYLVVDLDPGAPANVIEAARVGMLVRDVLAKLKLQSFIKASGSKGCQLYVPLNTAATYEKTGPFAERLATLLEESHGELVVSRMAKELRGGKVLIDWSQNVDYKTTVCAYSLRAKRSEPYVSMPMSWEEVERAVRKEDPMAFDFRADAALKRMAKLGDIFAPVLKLKQKLPPITALEAAASAAKGRATKSKATMTKATSVTKKKPAARKTGSADRSHDGSLEEYDAKRDFTQTAEPGPKRAQSKGSGKLMFVIQKHAASHLHYDFRLEMDGVLKSWAVPKGPPMSSAERRLAMHVEDHPMSYARFEGTIPPGNYGAGTVMVWDIGTYEVVEDKPLAAYHKGKIKMRMAGEKLKGEWTLVRSSREDSSGKQPWYLLKTGGEPEPIDDDFRDRSVLTRRTLDEITQQNDAQWGSNRSASKAKAKPKAKLGKRPARTASVSAREPRSKRLRAASAKAEEKSDSDRGRWARGPAEKPAFVRPMLAKLSTALPQGDDWLFEIKFDGFRCVAVKNGSRVDLFSRNGNSFNHNFPTIRQATAELPFDDVFDGEVVALTSEGTISFQALQGSGLSGATIHYYIFDLLNLNGRSLVKLPVTERKALLEEIYDWKSHALLHYSGALKGKASALVEAVREQGLEGLIAKKLHSIYEVGRRSDCWVKYKTNREGDFVIGGWRKLETPSGFDAIYVGYMDGGKLKYAAKVLAGFTPLLRRKLAETAKPFIAKEQPFHELKIGKGGRFSEGLTQEDVNNSVWLKPKMVAAIEFVEWTHAGHLRHPRFKGLRPDKEPHETNKPGTA